MFHDASFLSMWIVGTVKVKQEHWIVGDLQKPRKPRALYEEDCFRYASCSEKSARGVE
jgi:hypothetical protein